MKTKKEAPELLSKVTGANNNFNQHHKDNANSLYILFIGEFLHNGTLTIAQLNEGYNIRNADSIVKKLINAGTVQLVPNTNPKEYQFKTSDAEGFFK